MQMLRRFLVLTVVACLVPTLSAKPEPAKVGPEDELLQKMVGTWDLTMKAGGAESKGTAVYKMDLGGRWLSSSLELDLFGSKFQGKGMDTYDSAKKMCVSVWFDSTAPAPIVMEGTFDKEKKILTLTGTGQGQDGKMRKYKSLTAMPDADTIEFTMYSGEEKDPMFTITYKRKKK
jgi:hypothetical protein